MTQEQVVPSHCGAGRAKMEVEIVSREFIKPSSPSAVHNRPHKLSLFDQLTPSTYSTFVVFYPNAPPLSLLNLKHSLSQTLTLFYPFSGRITRNLAIDRFHEGALLVHARTHSPMLPLLKSRRIEILNRLVPFQPFRKEMEADLPLIGVQFTRFACGGISIGMSVSHKQVDGPTGKAFFDSWASICRGDFNAVVVPRLEQASEFFPARISLPRNHLSLMEMLWFTEADYVTRRFVFNRDAIAALRAKAEGPAPSRIETLSCFIWKCCMRASKANKASVLVEAVNLRPSTEPPMSDASTGNVFWWATAVADAKAELPELMKLLSEAIELYKSDYTGSFQGEEGHETMSDYISRLEELFSAEKPDIFAFTTWCYLGFNRLDFGWGEPMWTGLLGKVGPAFRNHVIFIETKDGKGIEAWMTLDEQRMSLLEHDPEFLAFASPNPMISSL